MKASEMRQLASEDLATRLAETKEELFNLRFQQATGQLENYGRLGEVKREVARAITLLKERQLGIEPEPGEDTGRSRRRSTREPAAADAAVDEGAEEDEE